MTSGAPRIGLDLVRITRVRDVLTSASERWRRRVFTDDEWRAAEKSDDPARTLALCFAGKEAAFKVLSTGWGEGVAWQEVEVRTRTQDDPTLSLTGRAAEVAHELGVTLTASVSHTDELAMAMVIGQ